MDKKNTMLLTVIAVATLLVAVVGATFAYFTASNTATGSTTATVQTEKVGTVAVGGGAVLKLNLNENHMTQATAGADGKTYWATADGDHVTAQNDVVASKLTITKGEDSTVYNCTLTLEVTKTGDYADLEEGDAALVLTAADGVTLANGGSIDMTEVASEYTATFSHTGNATDKTLVEAAVSFTNKAAEQDHFAGKGFEVTVTNKAVSCTMAD